MQNNLRDLKYNITAYYTCLVPDFLNKILQVTTVITLFTYLHCLPCYDICMLGKLPVALITSQGPL